MKKTRDVKLSRNVKMLYKVDPKRLSVTLCYAMSSKDKPVEGPPTTFENFFFEKKQFVSDVPEQIGTLPVFFNGCYFFRTEEEAQDFVRRQIGM